MTEFDDQIISLLTVTRNFMGFPRSYNTTGAVPIQTVIHPDESLNLNHDGVFYALTVTLDDQSRTLEMFITDLNNITASSDSQNKNLYVYDRTVPFDKLIERCFQPSPFDVGSAATPTVAVRVDTMSLIEKMSRIELTAIMRSISKPDSLAAALWLHHIATLWVMVREYLIGQSVGATITNMNEAVHEIVRRTVDGMSLDGVAEIYTTRTVGPGHEADPLSTIMNIIQLKMVDVSRRTIVDFLQAHYRKGFEDHVREKFNNDPEKERQMLIMASTWTIRDPAEYLTALLTIEKYANDGGADNISP